MTNFQAAGSHRLIGGAAITTGQIKSTGSTFDFDFQIDPVIVPNLTDIPATGFQTVKDDRTFVGLYVNDQWTPVPFLTISGGARYDLTSETQNVVSTDEGASQATKHADQWSGGGSILGRVLTNQGGLINDLNVYFAGKTNFKPAAPDLHVLSAVILSPERTTSEEVGIKSNLWCNQVSFNASYFHMIFNNLVVSIEGPNGQPQLVNAGKELFEGYELEFSYRPVQLPYFGFVVGYAHHNALYKVFSFIDPDEGLLDASGQQLELTPRNLWNLGASYGPPSGLRRLVCRPAPGQAALRQDQRGLHAAVLRVGPRPLVHLRVRRASRSSAATSATAATTSVRAKSATPRTTSRSRGDSGARWPSASSRARIPSGPASARGPGLFLCSRSPGRSGCAPRPNKKAARADGGPHEPREIRV